MAKILFCVVKKIWAKNWVSGQDDPGVLSPRVKRSRFSFLVF